ncbi:Hydrogenase-4 component B [bacterium HR13]|nr:Hydrogenase-4 component B [bacterium HR13]
MMYMPFLLSGLGILLSLSFDVFKMSYFQILLSIGIFVSGIYIFLQDGYLTYMYGIFFTDPINCLMLLTVSFLELFVSLYSFGYIRTETAQGVPKRRFRYYYFWKNAFILSMFVSILSNNLGVYWVGLEATTLATAFLIAFYRSKESYEASWKYVMMCSIGITLGLFAVVLLYYATAKLYGESLSSLSFVNIISVANSLDKKLLFLSFILALVGFGTKAGFAPMHNWLPDAHSQAPSPISALLSGVLLNTALLGVIRFYQINQKAGIVYAGKFLLFFGTLTLFLASLLMLKQSEYKRLFAYSSMENMGVISLGLSMGGLATFGALIHILFHALSKGVLFMAAGNILSVLHKRKINEVKALFKGMKRSAFILTFGLAGISGFPPFSTFLSKMYTIVGTVQKSPLLGMVMLLSISLAFAGLFYQMLPMLFGEESKEKEKNLHPLMLLVPATMLITLLVFTFYLPQDFLKRVWDAVHEIEY